MRVALAALGSDGDVAPVVAIGSALARRRHEVRVVALERYAATVREAGLGLEAVRAGGSPLWPEVAWLRRLALLQPGVMFATMLASFQRIAPHTNRALLRAAVGADVIVSGTVTRGACHALAESTGARHVSVLHAPLLPARTASATSLGLPGLGPQVTHATSSVMWALTRALSAAHTGDMRRRLAGGPRTPLPMLTLVGTSPLVSPPAPEWPRDVEQVGWIRSTGGRAPVPAEVRRFMAAGPPPVVMSFGSSPVVSPRRDRDLFVAAARRAAVRLLVPGVPESDRFADGGVLFAGGMDFAELLPDVAAVVHHGGAGITHTALAAGAPAVVVPHLGDQGYYARRVAELGAGPRGVPRWRLAGPRHLAALVTAALDEDVAVRARGLSARLGDDGAERVADRIEASASTA